MYDSTQLMDETVEERSKQFRKYVAQTSPYSLEFPIVRAKGSFLYDARGKEYIDFTSGIGVMNLGHSNSAVVSAMHQQMERYTHTMVYGEHLQDSQIEYAEWISQALGADRDLQTFFVNSGNESVDLALKMARKITGRKPVLAVMGGFHGRGYGSMQVTWNQKYKQGFFVDDHENAWLAPNEKEALQEVYWGDYAAVVLEIVQGEAGCVQLDKEWVNELVTKAQLHGCMVIFDEVQTGYGRLGTLFGQEQVDVIPDITCLGKAGGGGLPFGAVVAHRFLFEALQDPPLSHLTTFGGNPVVMAAGLAMAKQLTPERLKNVQDRSKQLVEGINQLASQFKVFTGVQGAGLMLGLKVELGQTEAVYNACKKRGLLLHFKLNAPTTLRMSPPLIISEQLVNEVLEILAEVGWELSIEESEE